MVFQSSSLMCSLRSLSPTAASDWRSQVQQLLSAPQPPAQAVSSVSPPSSDPPPPTLIHTSEEVVAYQLLVRTMRDGGLGIVLAQPGNVVDSDDVPDRLVNGDRITAVDGKLLGALSIAYTLDAEKREYVLTIERNASLPPPPEAIRMEPPPPERLSLHLLEGETSEFGTVDAASCPSCTAS